MSLRNVWWHSTADAHLAAALGTALFVPTCGLAPFWMVRRGVGGAAATHHLSWAAMITSALITGGVFLGRILPTLLHGIGPAWAPTHDALVVVGAMWMVVAFATPVLFSLVHALVALRLAAGFRVRLRRTVSQTVPRPARPPVPDAPSERALMVIRSATSRCVRARMLVPSRTLAPLAEPVRLPGALRPVLIPIGGVR